MRMKDSQRMLKSHENKKNYGKHEINENPLLRIGQKWGKAATTYQLLLGKIEKC